MPPSGPTVQAPAGFVPEHVVAFGSAGSPAVPVDDSHPLPTSAVLVAAVSAPLSGTTTASGTLGPFTPQLGRSIWLTLGGSWSGSVTVQRSTDGGTTKRGLTLGGQPWASFAGNAQEPVGEEVEAGASWWLAVNLSAGSLDYRVAQ